MRIEKNKKVIFDICGTLYSLNTTFSFINFLASKGLVSSLYIKVMKCLKVPLILLGRLIQRDIYRYLYIYSLRGVHERDLISYAEQFYKEVLLEHKIPAVMELFYSYRRRTDDVDIVLSSASLDCIVKVIALNLGVKCYFSSRLAYKNGLCQGKLKLDVLGRKHKLHCDNLQCVVTDNKSDLLLLMQAQEKVVVSKPKDVHFWAANGIPVSFVVDY